MQKKPRLPYCQHTKAFFTLLIMADLLHEIFSIFPTWEELEKQTGEERAAQNLSAAPPQGWSHTPTQVPSSWCFYRGCNRSQSWNVKYKFLSSLAIKGFFFSSINLLSFHPPCSKVQCLWAAGLSSPWSWVSTFTWAGTGAMEQVTCACCTLCVHIPVVTVLFLYWPLDQMFFDLRVD